MWYGSAVGQHKGRYYDSIARKLVYISNEANPDMWDDHWKLNEGNARKILSKKDGTIIKVTAGFLKPQDGVIVEGGCGNGRKVHSLMQAGYTVIGIDFAPQTVSILNRAAPELDIRFGDVRNLPLKDSSVIGYWSLGVIEHFYSGFDDVAKEMVRVIQPGGYLFLAHPFMSPLRKAKARIGIYPSYNCHEKPKGFYQFALDHRSVISTFQSLGFTLCQFKMKSGLPGFNEEVPTRLTMALQNYRGSSILIRAIRYIANKAFSYFAGHSCLLVFRLSGNSY